MTDIMKHQWFWGDIEKDDCESLLKGFENGFFLVRASKSHASQPFTISRLIKDEKKLKIVHHRVDRTPDGNLNINVPTKNGSVLTTGKNLIQLIKLVQKPMKLKKAVPGSKYSGLFVDVSKGEYPDDFWNTDEQ